VEGRGDGLSSGGRWCFVKMPVTEEEVRGWPFDEGEMKGLGCWFGSAPSGCRRAAHDGAWRGGASGEAACHTQFLRLKPDAHRMYAQDQVAIHTVRM
jgi:hypothetical protein